MCLLSHSGNIYLAQRNHLLTQENAPPQSVLATQSQHNSQFRNLASSPTVCAQLQARAAYKELQEVVWGEERGRRGFRIGKTLPKLRTPGVSPYPSHSKSSVDWILHSAGCLPKIKYKIHNFLFNCSLALVRISPGDSWESKYLTRFLHQHSHLDPPETTGLVLNFCGPGFVSPFVKPRKGPSGRS